MADIRHLYLMRHAEAEGLARSDALRSLTPRGFAQAQLAGQWLAKQGLVLDMVCCSPYLRARQTAAEVCRALSSAPQFELEELLPSGDTQQLLVKLEQMSLPDGSIPARLLWVTHQPLLGKLRNVLVEGCVGNGYPVAPANIMLLGYEYIGPACASLVWSRDVVDFGQVHASKR